jgi:hypothetical protein
VLYHGVLAPHSRWRRRVGTYAGADPTRTLAVDPAPKWSAPGDPLPPPVGKPRSWAWADLMRRAFDIDVLACPRCGGRMRLIATVEAPQLIRQILASLGLPTEGPPPRPPPAQPADRSA